MLCWMGSTMLWQGLELQGTYGTACVPCAKHASLRLVTGSRKRLRELCKTEDSRTSDFWEIFYDTPLMVGCLEEEDWEDFLHPFESRAIAFDSSGPERNDKLDRWRSDIGRRHLRRVVHGHSQWHHYFKNRMWTVLVR